MNIESQMHVANEIGSFPAKIESLDSYEDRIHFYKDNDYTYIPLPLEGKYYDTNEGWMRSINLKQFIERDTHLMEVMRRLQDYPFLLINRDPGEFYIVENDDGIHPVEASILRFVKEGAVTFDDTSEYDVTDEEFLKAADETDPIDTFELRKTYPEVSDEFLDKSLEEQLGMITLADLNKRPMKQMLYKVVSELGALLSDKIEDHHSESESLFNLLRPETIGRWKKDQMEGLSIHIAEHMNILEMMQVIQSSDSHFVTKCGFESKDDVQSLNEINEIRKRVMHSNRSLVYDRHEIQEIIDAVNESQRIINNAQ